MNLVIGIDPAHGKDRTAFCAAEKLADGTIFIHDSGFVQPREVCAARARVLRKRGEYVKFVRNTVNGKARFQWLMRTK